MALKSLQVQEMHVRNNSPVDGDAGGPSQVQTWVTQGVHRGRSPLTPGPFLPPGTPPMCCIVLAQTPGRD